MNDGITYYGGGIARIKIGGIRKVNTGASELVLGGVSADALAVVVNCWVDKTNLDSA